MGVGDGLDQQALVRLGRNDRRPGIAPLEHGLATVQPQARRLLLGAVAFHALVDQDRPDPRLEKFDGRGRKRIAVHRRGFRIVGRGQARPAAHREDDPGQTMSESHAAKPLESFRFDPRAFARKESVA